MGRYKKSEEERAKNISISLKPKHRKMLDDICEKIKNDKVSDVIQGLIEKEHERLSV